MFPKSMGWLRRIVVGLLGCAVWMTCWLVAPHVAQAQATLPQSAEDLAFTQIVTVGQGGFTEAFGPQGVARRVVFGGTRNGVRTLYLYDDGAFIEVLPADGTLPGGLGTASAFLAQYRMTPAGDILFRANVAGGSLPAGQYTFRWHNGVITVQPAAGPNFNYMTSDGRWLVEEESGTFPTNTFTYFLTDGVTKEPLISLTGLETDCHTTRFKVHAANAGGVVAYTETKVQKTGIACSGGVAFLTEWSLRLGGPINQTMLSGVFTTTIGSSNRTGIGIDMLGSILNDVNQLVTVRESYTGATTTRQVVVVEGGGIAQVLFPTTAPPDQQVASNLLGLVKYFDDQARIAAMPRLGSGSGPFALIRGNNLPTDVVIKMGDPLFGSTVALLQPTFSAFADAAVVGENRGYYFTYALADGTQGIALASKNIPRWANPGDGDWATAANWTPAAVPVTTTEVVFDLPQSYAVTLGAQQVAGVSVKKGNVAFRNGTLTVSPLNLAVADPTGAISPRLTIGGAASSRSGADFATTVNANVLVGPGELRLDNAELRAPNIGESPGSAELGVIGPASATVTNGAIWRWQRMTAGAAFTSTLRIEDGAFVGDSPAAEMIIGGSGSGLVQNHVARVIVDNAANNPGPLGLGTALGASITNLVVGQELIGALDVTNGGSVFAIDLIVGALDHGSRTDGALTVSGANASNPSTVEVGNAFANNGALFAATGQGTDAQLEIMAGGLLNATGIALAAAPQSSALVFVDGVNGPHRSSLLAPLPGANDQGAPNPAAGMCVVGQAGQAALNVSNGGLVQCRNIAVGLLEGSRGEINIGAGGSQVIARGTANGDGLVCIGGVTACGGPGAGARGDVTISQGGMIEGEMVLVGTGGRVRGSGTILALDGVHLVGGSVSPGITILEPGTRMAAAHTTGVLTITGNLLISPTSVITLHVLGGTPALQDRLVVSGTASLNGELALNFGNGYAPKQGDQLTLIQANAVTGAPLAVTVSGLQPGFEFRLDTTGGTLALTALNDGVPVDQEVVRPLYLPLITKPY